MRMPSAAGFAVFFLLVTGTATAQDIIGVQGFVQTSGGAPADGTFAMTFRLFSAETGGAAVYSQDPVQVNVAGGLFDAEVGPLPAGLLDAGPSLWFETQVETEVLPRRPLRAVAYALAAHHATTAGLASDLECPGCVSSDDVAFAWAAGVGKDGAAVGLECDKCVDPTDLAPSSVASGHIQTGAVTADKVSFAYAKSSGPNGPATDVVCDHCVNGGDIAVGADLEGTLGVAGSVAACKSNAAGCSVKVSEAGLFDHNDGWLNVQVQDGVRIRSLTNASYEPIAFGGGSSYGSLQVSGGDLTVDGKVGVGTGTPSFALDVAGAVNASEFRINGAPFTGGVWSTSSTSAFYDQGNVGVGTGSPSARLTVSTGDTTTSPLRVDAMVQPVVPWPQGWELRRPITVTNGGVPLSDFQVLVANPVHDESELRLSYHFDEGGGLPRDTSRHGGDATSSNAAASTSCAFGGCLSFNGSTEVRLAAPAGGPLDVHSAITTEAWIWHDGSGINDWQTVMRTTSHSFGMWVGNNNVAAGQSRAHCGVMRTDGAWFATTSPSTIRGGWHHVACTYTSADGTVRMYVDGVAAATTYPGAGAQIAAPNGELHIGSEPETSPRRFTGRLDELRIYGRSLSAAEIAAHFDAGVAPDYRDLRFTSEDGAFLPHWKETDGRFWVKVPSVPTGQTKIYAYYGNPTAASTSDGEATFELFDDFDGTSVDGAKWAPVGSTWGASNGYLEVPASGSTGVTFAFLSSKAFEIQDGVIETLQIPLAIGPSQGKGVVFRYSSESDLYISDLEAWATQNTELGRRVGGGWVNLASVGTAGGLKVGRAYRSVTRFIGSSFEHRITNLDTGQVTVATASDTSHTAAASVGFAVDRNETNTGARFDYMLVRKAAPADPAVALGAVETPADLPPPPAPQLATVLSVQAKTGRVGIGIESPSYQLDVKGNLRAVGITDASDARLKTDVETIHDALKRVGAMRGVSFRWIDQNVSAAPQIGLIAQEVEAVYPEAVSTGTDGMKSVAYGKLVAPLIEAVKALRESNEELREAIDELRRDNEDLRARLSDIERGAAPGR